MIEVYSATAQEMTAGTIFMLGLFVIVGVGLLTFFVINTIKTITSHKINILAVFMGIFAAGFAVFWLYTLISGVSGSEKTYSEQLKAWESGAYSVESGIPEALDVYKPPRSSHDDGCEVSFWLNGKYFDTANAFGGDIISDDEWAIIKNSKAFEVKYITDEEGSNVIFSLSVDASDAETVDQSNGKENLYD